MGHGTISTAATLPEVEPEEGNKESNITVKNKLEKLNKPITFNHKKVNTENSSHSTQI